MLLALPLLLSACDATPEAPAPATPPAAPTANDDATGPDTWTIGIVDVPRTSAPSVVTQVRAARHDATGSTPGFDRVVFELSGAGVPGYHVEYVDRPAHQCASGAPLTVAGENLLLVRLTPALAHTDDGVSTTPAESTYTLPVVREIERTCDYEATATWVIGVGPPNGYRVFELAAPPRLVVDIRH